MALIIRGTRDVCDPCRDVRALQQEVDRFFGRAAGATAPEGAWAVPLDIYERKNEVIVRAELPGFRREDLDVSVQENVLTIKGTRSQEAEVANDQVYRRELAYGAFFRQLELPQGLNQDALKASYKDGILEVVLPKREEAKPKQVRVDVN